MKAFISAAALAALLATSSPVAAQSGDKGGEKKDDKNDTSLFILTVGPGARLRPTFPGANDGELALFPLIQVRKAGADPVFSTPDQSTSVALLRSEGFRAGPAVRLGRERDEEDAIDGIGDVKRAVEIGAFAESYLSSTVRARGELRKGIGGHKGLLADVGGDMIFGKVTEPFHFSIGPRVRLADKNYVRAYYGIDAGQSQRTGLRVHDADGGIHSAGALASMRYRLNGGYGVQGYARYDRLLGDAADSPLVRSSVGSANQFEVGLGLTYSFGI